MTIHYEHSVDLGPLTLHYSTMDRERAVKIMAFWNAERRRDCCGLTNAEITEALEYLHTKGMAPDRITCNVDLNDIMSIMSFDNETVWAYLKRKLTGLLKSIWVRPKKKT